MTTISPTAAVPNPPSTTGRRKASPRISPERVHEFVADLLGDDVHATRVLSFANGVVGVIHSAALGIHVIGRGFADAMGLEPKHAIKQIDRMLSNEKIDVWAWFHQWVAFVVAARTEIVVAMDWTEFDKDDHSVIAIYALTSHGRATPLVWRTVRKSELKLRRSEHEADLIRHLHEILPDNVDITLLADRGFGGQDFFAFLEALGWEYAIRVRGNIHITCGDQTMLAKAWVPKSGHAKILRGVGFTQDQAQVPAVVVKHQKGMKEPWCIATSLAAKGAADIVKLYSRRFTIEETFRDMKDNHFGMGLSATHIGVPARRDRLLLMGAISHALLTLLGAAGEACGLDSRLKANTVKTRTMSLYNQGCCWYRMIPTMREEWLRPLMREFGKAIENQAAFSQIFGII